MPKANEKQVPEFSAAKLRRVLKSHCGAHDVRRYEVAEQLGVTNMNLGNWMRGEYGPTRENFVRLLDVFEVPPSALLDRDGDLGEVADATGDGVGRQVVVAGGARNR